MPPILLRSVPALLALAFSTGASASAFQLWEQNASGLGVAYAGSAAVAENASTVFFNPAGMAQLTGVQLSGGVTGVGPSYRFHNNGSTGTSGGEGGDAGGLHAVPNLYVAARLSPDWSLGMGISSPFGLRTEYEAGWIGRAQALKSEITTVNYNPSVAYRVNDKVALGLGLNYQTINAELSSMPVGIAYRLKGDDSAWGWNAGALFTLSPAMRVGVSYRSAMDYHLSGTTSLNGASQAATANLKLPDTYILSVWQQLSERWEAMGDLSLTRWSTINKLTVQTASGSASEDFNYKDSWRIAWGAAYKSTDDVKLKFGIAYDRTPVRDGYRSARVPDNNRLWLSVGGQWNTKSYGVFDLGYSYLYVKDPVIEQTVGSSTLRGDYDASAHILGLQYSVGF